MNAIGAVTDTGPSRVRSVAHGGITEHFLQLQVAPGGDPAELFSRLDRMLRDLGSPVVVRVSILGEINTQDTEHLQQRYCYDCAHCALHARSARADGGCPVAGVFVQAVSGAQVRPLWLGAALVGHSVTDAHARYAILDGLLPERNLTPIDQAAQLFQRMEDALAQVDMTFADHVARTWFYLDDILDWYGDFNQARDQFFRARGVFDKRVPASTGIGGANRAGAAIRGDLLAVQPLHPDVVVQPVPSPLQCPALEYGSSFARAMEILTPDLQRLTVSGTASIAPEGHTLHVGDVDAQIDLSMRVVHAILEARGLSWEHSVRAVGYTKNRADFDRYRAWADRNGLAELPVALVQNDVCRDDLLFELELDAVRERTR